MADDTIEHDVDPVSDILKWVLLVIAIVCFALMGWASLLTYRDAPPIPQAIVDPHGAVLVTGEDIVAGKGGFQKADLMDYGSIYGMGSYFGEDYTASTLVRLGVLAKQSIAQSNATPPGTIAPANKSLATTGPAGPPPPATTPPATSLAEALADAAVTAAMQKQLQSVDLTKPKVVVSDAVAQAIRGIASRARHQAQHGQPFRRLDARAQPQSPTSHSDRRLHYLFGPDDGGAAA